MRINLQPPEKKIGSDISSLNVFKIWKTIQGEGPLVGVPSVFIRLAGCNLQCPACDTDYTSTRVWMTPYQIYDEVLAANHGKAPKQVVLTGGEPFRQNFGSLARLILSKGVPVQVETNGTLWQDDLPIIPLQIVCSPKGSIVHEKLKPYIGYLKYVIRAGEVDPSDGLPINALGGVRPWRPMLGTFPVRNIFVQPLDEDDKTANEANIKAAVESSWKFGYTFGLQIHKILGLE